MPNPTLYTLPDQASFKVQDGVEVLTTKLDGGAGRYRRDQLGATAIGNCTFTGPSDLYDYVRAFYRRSTLKGSSPFQMWMIYERSFPQLYTCYFTPGSLSTPSIDGLTYSFSCQLEVIPQLEDDAGDDAIIASWNPTLKMPGFAFVSPLDDIPGAVAVYSLYRLISTYQGPLIRLERNDGGDPAQLDIYPDGSGFIDMKVVNAFCGYITDNPTVVAMYDQTGQGNDAVLFAGHPAPSLDPTADPSGMIGFGGSSLLVADGGLLPDGASPHSTLLGATLGGTPGTDGWEYVYSFGSVAHPRGTGKVTTGDHFFAGNTATSPSSWGASPRKVVDTNDGTTTKLYADNAVVQTTAEVFATVAGSLVIGGDPSKASEWKGNLSTLAIFGRALTAAEIALLQSRKF